MCLKELAKAEEMAALDERDLRIYRLTNRAGMLEIFLEEVLLSLPKEETLRFLREFSSALKREEHKTFPKLDAVHSDLASAELQEEVEYLQSFITSLAAKAIQR
ncbi:MAG: hypothetical protein NVSMB34_07510 [Variovorax sp.]